MPQLALQQTMPASHVALPQGTPPVLEGSGTQTPWPSRASQRLFARQLVAAQGCMPVTQVGTGSHGACTHCTVVSSQCWSSGQTWPSQGSAPVAVGGVSPPPGGVVPWFDEPWDEPPHAAVTRRRKARLKARMAQKLADGGGRDQRARGEPTLRVGCLPVRQRSTEAPPAPEDFAGMTEAMITFRRVVHDGSFTRAARALETTTSAVSKRVTRLEDKLGVRLLERTSRRVALTEAGEIFHERVLDILAAMNDATAEASMLGGEARGTLRVSAPILLGERMLPPLVAAFHARHPKVRLAIELADRFVDLVAEGYDCAIRIGPGPDASLVSKKIGRMSLVTVASPAYVARHGEPKSPEGLHMEHGIRYSVAKSPEEWPFAAGVRRRPSGPLEVSHGGLVHKLVALGLGIASLPHFEVADDLARGALVELVPRHRPPDLDVQVVFPTRRHVPAKVRAFVDEATRVLGPQLEELERRTSPKIVARGATKAPPRRDLRTGRGRRTKRT